jgi:hypothetical protein
LPILISEAEAARIAPWNKNCLADQKKWQKKAKHKAVAVTKIYPNGQGCGHSWGWPTIEEAKADAMKRCKARLLKNYPKTKDKCILIEVR